MRGGRARIGGIGAFLRVEPGEVILGGWMDGCVGVLASGGERAGVLFIYGLNGLGELIFSFITCFFF